MIINVMATLLVTPKQPTTLQFEHPVEYYSLGNANEFDTYLSKNNKILLIRPKKNNFNEILVVITKDHSYEFKLKSNAEKLTALYQIKHAKRDKFFSLKMNKDRFQILEGRNTLKILRVRTNYLVINGVKNYMEVIFYPKGAYLNINGQVIP